MSNKLLIADLHLTDNPLDEYRWELFDLVEGVISDESVHTLDILGDLTDKKDNHSSKLVNRLINRLLRLSSMVDRLTILRGNHDAVDAEDPFFEWVSNFKDITYISKPVLIKEVLYIPYTKDFDSIVQVLKKHHSLFIQKSCNFIFMHQPMFGARLQNNFILDRGVKTNIFDNLPDNVKIFSGDIHTPQTIGRVQYIGAPYHVNFGDNFKGGGIIIQPNEEKRIPFFNISRWGITISNEMELENYKLLPKDQVKIKVELVREDFYKWDKIKKNIKSFCRDKMVELVSLEISPKKVTMKEVKQTIEVETEIDVIHRFGRQEKLSDIYTETAEEIICS